MLAKAHIAVGMAAAFSIVRPETVAEALPVITGGALGCLICDLDCENKSEKSALPKKFKKATHFASVIHIG